MNNIWLSKSIEGNLESSFRGNVLWLNFKSSDGKSAAININNMALRHGVITKQAIREALKEYFLGK